VLSLGGVLVQPSSSLGLDDNQDPCYAPFISSAPYSETRLVNLVANVVRGIPAAPLCKPLFECEGAWSAYPDGMGYRIVSWSEDAGTPRLVAHSNADTTQVTIHVGESWARAFAESEGDIWRRVGNPFRYPLDQLLLMYHLAGRGGVIVHSAGLELAGKALVFPGVSTAGKSTLARVLVEAGLKDSLLSDDRIIVRTMGGESSACGPDDGAARGLLAWGTPWPGDAKIARNACAPLAALLFLVKDERTFLVPLSPGEAMRRLMPVVSCPWYDSERLPGVLDTCARLAEGVPCFDLHFRPDAEVAALLTGHEW
jgi:hypothetical protein